MNVVNFYERKISDANFDDRAYETLILQTKPDFYADSASANMASRYPEWSIVRKDCKKVDHDSKECGDIGQGLAAKSRALFVHSHARFQTTWKDPDLSASAFS
jgi:hypothetical protein